MDPKNTDSDICVNLQFKTARTDLNYDDFKNFVNAVIYHNLKDIQLISYRLDFWIGKEEEIIVEKSFEIFLGFTSSLNGKLVENEDKS